MSKIEFIISVLILACAGIMLVNVFVTPSIMRWFAIMAFSAIFLISIVLVRTTYKEMMKDIKRQ